MEHQNFSSNKNDPKTIYFVWNYVEWGGVQMYFLGLMRRASEKHRVKAILPKGSDQKILQYIEDNNIEYEFFEGKLDLSGGDIWQRIKRHWNHFCVNLSLAKHLSGYDWKNSIIQIDVIPATGFALLLYLSLKTNVFVTFHTAIQSSSFVRQSLLKIKFAILTAFEHFHIAASNFDVKNSLYPFVSEERYEQIKVVYSSVNIEEIEQAVKESKTRSEVAEEYKFPADKKWICNVAQFIERKGCWVFLEAIEILQKQRNDLFFYWLGTSALSKETLERIDAFGLSNFRFLSADETGNRKNLLMLLKMADMFVLPSFQEGLPVALIEAMALEQACIASMVNAIPEAVRHLETGILVDAGNSRKLASAIGGLADNPELRKEIGKNARNLVLENFEEKVTGQIMLELYECESH